MVRGRNPYLYDAVEIVSVRIAGGNSVEFIFDKEKRKLRIYDVYTSTNENLYGKEYLVKYVEDKQLKREEKIKTILE